MEIINQNQYKTLISEIGQVLTAGRQKAAWTVNTQLINTYWQIGQYIVEYEQKGNEKAIYGSELLKRLSKDLTDNYGKGFGLSNLKYIRKFYLAYPKGGTLSHLLTWRHYYEILNQLYLPNKEQLRQKLLTIMEQQQETDKEDI